MEGYTMLTLYIWGIIFFLIIYVVADFLIPIFRFISEADGIFDLYENFLKIFFEADFTEVSDSNQNKLAEIGELLEEIEHIINDLIDFYDESEIMYFLDRYEFRCLSMYQRKIKLANILYNIRMWRWKWYNKS